MSMDYEKIKRLVSLVEQNRLSELTVEEEGLSITVKAEQSSVTAATMPATQANVINETQPCETLAMPLSAEEPIAEIGPEPLEGDLVQIKSPMIGVFYRRPSPDTPSYVDVGDEIEVGQTIGIIEAMKVFSEIPSEVAGRVVSLPVENSKLVQQGEVLVVVDASGVSGS